ncbi:protein THEM6-like isoform X1 [Photinus pyralis]|uniref:Protein THEM6 n=1 Tax=Photinus pyralis TaxID=7054 RepID=A0A1Y1MS25_PHOPY|nr:protein THEM6-like isoform X1 [Photinus pyralis]XP_031341367.1 protein THEM6-like isoform X1 [Photinus pyralis]
MKHVVKCCSFPRESPCLIQYNLKKINNVNSIDSRYIAARYGGNCKNTRRFRPASICLTTDVDTFLYHMNNARFIRELDFARADFYERTGLFQCIRNKKGAFALGATTMRYRRFLRLFQRYIIKTKVVYWNEQDVFMEHRFVNLHDNFVNAIALVKIRFLNCTVADVMKELLEKTGVDASQVKPKLPLEVAKWIESNEISSTILRTENSPNNVTINVSSTDL